MIVIVPAVVRVVNAPVPGVVAPIDVKLTVGEIDITGFVPPEEIIGDVPETETTPPETCESQVPEVFGFVRRNTVTYCPERTVATSVPVYVLIVAVLLLLLLILYEKPIVNVVASGSVMVDPLPPRISTVFGEFTVNEVLPLFKTRTPELMFWADTMFPEAESEVNAPVLAVVAPIGVLLIDVAESGPVVIVP